MRNYLLTIILISVLFLTSCKIDSEIEASPDTEPQEGDIVTFDVSYVELKNKARTAREKQDTSLCEELPVYAGDIKRWCTEAIDYDIKKKAGLIEADMKYNLDEDFCDEFDSLKRMECLRFLALSAGDATYCDGVEDSDYKDRCLTEVAAEIGDINLCDVETDFRRDTCIDTTAAKTLNPSFCELSKNKELCLGGIEAAKPKMHKKFLE